VAVSFQPAVIVGFFVAEQARWRELERVGFFCVYCFGATATVDFILIAVPLKIIEIIKKS
jgi:hypothetical protein